MRRGPDLADDRLFDVIVWATDGSRVASHALPIARGLAQSAGARLMVVHVDELIAGRALSGPVQLDEADIKADVRKLVEQLRQDGVDAELTIVAVGAGGAAHVIADVARDAGADLIIAGTRGHSALTGLLVGSVTHRLLHIAPCPVLAVPPAQREQRA